MGTYSSGISQILRMMTKSPKVRVKSLFFLFWSHFSMQTNQLGLGTHHFLSLLFFDFTATVISMQNYTFAKQQSVCYRIVCLFKALNYWKISYRLSYHQINEQIWIANNNIFWGWRSLKGYVSENTNQGFQFGFRTLSSWALYQSVSFLLISIKLKRNFET